MRSFLLSRHRRANVWLDEIPPAGFSSNVTVPHLVRASLAIEAGHRIAAVEMSVPHGARISYCLLGAELVSSSVEGLEVIVPIDDSGPPLVASLAPPQDQAKIGLLEEYADAVVRGVAKIADTSGVPARASLRFRWAAHSSVGSSPSVFVRAAGIVVQLLMLSRHDGAVDDHVLEVLENS